MIFFDTNILIELLGEDETVGREHSERFLANVAKTETMVCNLVVVAEVAAGLAQASALLDDLRELAIDIAELDVPVAFRAAQAFREYRGRGGARSTILPDFLIAAHAETLGARFVTRDRRIAAYFPDLTLITPETHPHG